MKSPAIHIMQSHATPQPDCTLLKILIVTLQTILVILGLIAMGTLTSCHTAAGFGRDVEHAGQAIEDSATDHHHRNR